MAAIDAQDACLRLWSDGRLSAYYAPWDWVNTSAKVMLVGITPGLHQANEALREARRCLDAGSSEEESLRRADAVGAFSGPMRLNLVSMLDEIGLARALAISSTDRLFDSHHNLAAHVSAIDVPLFVEGKNYAGSDPPIAGHPGLRSLIRASLGARVAMAPGALVVPLGVAARKAVAYLVGTGLLDESRCLVGMPHPSGLNGWRKRHFAERKEELTEAVGRWQVRT